MRYAWFGWLCLVLAAGAAGAAVPGGIPAQTSLLTDEADVLTVEEHAALLARLLAIQRSGRAQIAVLISSGTGGVPLSDHALRVAEAWQIGRAGRDDGLLILIVPSINGARLEVGYGLEGAIPDARASQWLDDLIPAIRNKQFAEGLDQLLTRIDAVLPLAETKTATDERNPFEKHPEWGVPFALVVFSLFSLFPLFLGRAGGVASAFLLAAFIGGAAWTFWESRTAGLTAAAAVFPLPLLWALNRDDDYSLKPWLRYAKAFGNLTGILMFFAIITLFVSVGLWAAGGPLWPGFFFSGLLTTGLAIFLFPGKPADYLSYFLRSAVHFTFILVVAYIALVAFLPDPLLIAFGAAAAVTTSIALGLYFDSREQYRGSQGTRWSMWFYSLAILITLPFALVALFMAIGGEDLQMRIAQAAAGGGSIAGILALAARYGLIAAVKVGLGGRFGGGGAGRSD